MARRRLTTRILDAVITALTRANADDLSDLPEPLQQSLADAEDWAKGLRAARMARNKQRRSNTKDGKPTYVEG